MLKLNEPQQYWGIAHWATDSTKSLFTDELFVFKRDADAYIERLKATRVGSNGAPLEDGYARPVLLNVTVAVCSEDAAASYHQHQSKWLEEKGQSRLRANIG